VELANIDPALRGMSYDRNDGILPIPTESAEQSNEIGEDEIQLIATNAEPPSLVSAGMRADLRLVTRTFADMRDSRGFMNRRSRSISPPAPSPLTDVGSPPPPAPEDDLRPITDTSEPPKAAELEAHEKESIGIHVEPRNEHEGLEVNGRKTATPEVDSQPEMTKKGEHDQPVITPCKTAPLSRPPSIIALGDEAILLAAQLTGTADVKELKPEHPPGKESQKLRAKSSGPSPEEEASLKLAKELQFGLRTRRTSK
jgi:hypothetical protein